MPDIKNSIPVEPVIQADQNITANLSGLRDPYAAPEGPLPTYAPQPGSVPPEPEPSYFDGRTIQLIGWRLLGLLLTAVTLGIGAPWAQCMVLRWETKHTVVEGKRLYFDGKGHQLLGRYLLWGLLTVITLGIYALFIPVRMRKWRASHTRFAKDWEAPEPTSGILIFGLVTAGIAVAVLIALVAALMFHRQTAPVQQNTWPSDEWLYQDGYWIMDDEGSVIFIPESTDTPLEEDQWYISSNGSQVPLRRGPHTDYEIVDYLNHGDIVEVEYMDDMWACVGDDRWCSSEFLTKEKPDPAEMPTEPQTTAQPTQTEEDASDSGLVGSWLAYSPAPDPTICKVFALELNSDGTFTIISDTYWIEKDWESGDYCWQDSGLSGGGYKGTYSYSGGVLTLHCTSQFVQNYTSEPGSWQAASWTRTHKVTETDSGDMIYISSPEQFTDGTNSRVLRIIGSVGNTMDIYFPDGME